MYKHNYEINILFINKFDKNKCSKKICKHVVYVSVFLRIFSKPKLKKRVGFKK